MTNSELKRTSEDDLPSRGIGQEVPSEIEISRYRDRFLLSIDAKVEGGASDYWRDCSIRYFFPIPSDPTPSGPQRLVFGGDFFPTPVEWQNLVYFNEVAFPQGADAHFSVRCRGRFKKDGTWHVGACVDWSREENSPGTLTYILNFKDENCDNSNSYRIHLRVSYYHF